MGKGPGEASFLKLKDKIEIGLTQMQQMEDLDETQLNSKI